MSIGDIFAESAARKATEAVATALVGAVVHKVAELLGPDKVAAARAVAGGVIDNIPEEVFALLRDELDVAAVRRANAIADAAENAKGLL